jgi:hypothetical protein
VYLELGGLPTTAMWHRAPSLNPLCTAKLHVLVVYLFHYLVCNVQVQCSGDSSEHGRVLTKDRNNFELKKFFPLRGTKGLPARNLAKGLHGMLPANDVPVDVLPLVPMYLLSVLNNLLVHVRHVIHNRFHTPVLRCRSLLQR